MIPAERHHPEHGDPIEHERHTARYERAADLADIASDAVWLDIGCGYGYGTALLAKRAKANLVVGIDPNEAATLYAAGNYHSMHTIFMNADSNDAAEWFPARFDCVVCIETLEHLAHREQAPFLDNLRTVLAPGGVLVLMCPIGTGTNPLNPWHLHEPTEYELKTILWNAGFHIEYFELADYESTSGPAVQATVLCK